MFISKFIRIFNILIGDFPSEYEWLILLFLITLIITLYFNIKGCIEW